MIKIALAVVVHQPLEQVFNYVTDLINSPNWMTQVTESEKVTTGSIGIGTVYRQNLDFLGAIHPTKFTITEYEPNKNFSYEYETSVFSSRDNYTFEEVDLGTRLTVRQQMQFGGVYRLSEGMVKSRVQDEMVANLKSLKKVMELN